MCGVRRPVGALIERMRDTFRDLPDLRKGGNHQRYTLEDAALSAFAVFFTQSPSFLDYQVRMQKERGRNNAASLFGVHDSLRPADPQPARPGAPGAARAAVDGHR